MRTIKVQGKGNVNAEPDQVTLSFSIDVLVPDYAGCLNALNDQVDELRQNLNSVGVDQAELKTADFGVSTETRWNKKREEYVFEGYSASHRLRISLPLEKELLNKVLHQVTEGYSGADKPKVEVIRAVRSTEPICDPAQLLAIVSDVALSLGLPRFDLDDVAGLADLIEARFLSS